MPSDHPPSPQSPNQQHSFETVEYTPKLSTSPNLGNSLPTPAHSINGSMSSTGDLPAFADPTNLEEASNKRKRDEGDNGDREQKKVHVEEGRISMEDLHLDVGPKYKLCNTPHSASPIPYSQDLFQRYDLVTLAKGVARTNPDGTKSVIRKSYKGYIARIFQMPGAYDAVKKEREDPTTLLAQMTLPDDEWDVKYRTAASQIKNGLPPLALKQLPTALTMAKGNLPKEVWDPKVLGDTGKAAAPDQARLIQQSGGRTPQHVPSVPGAPRPSKGEPVRPKRNIKKRTYQDGSFEGYGEGFTDDYENGYSTGGDAEDRAGGRKRLKKFGATQSQFVPRQGSYSSGGINH